MILLCYPRCSTCQRAKKWLDERNIKYEERNIKENNPSFSELTTWYKKSNQPIKKLINTSGQVYKSMQLKDKLPHMSDEEILTLLSSDGMLVKRPLLILDEKIIIGFHEEEWKELL